MDRLTRYPLPLKDSFYSNCGNFVVSWETRFGCKFELPQSYKDIAFLRQALVGSFDCLESLSLFLVKGGSRADCVMF